MSRKDRQHNGQKFEGTKGVPRSRKSMKDRQHKAKKNPKMVIRSRKWKKAKGKRTKDKQRFTKHDT